MCFKIHNNMITIIKIIVVINYFDIIYILIYSLISLQSSLNTDTMILLILMVICRLRKVK